MAAINIMEEQILTIKDREGQGERGRERGRNGGRERETSKS